jgi:hypothetical protein
MVQTRSKRFRVTIDEDETIKRNAGAEGFKEVSSYLRYLSLRKTPKLLEKVAELTDLMQRSYDLLVIISQNVPIQNAPLGRNSKQPH